MTNGNHTIMVVEDNREMRHLISRFFSKAGYVVKSAANGMEAMLLLDQSISLIITDEDMPNMTGQELRAYVKRVHPHIPVFGITGIRGHTPADLHKAFDDLMLKPFRLGDLLERAVRLMFSAIPAECVLNPAIPQTEPLAPPAPQAQAA